MVALFSGIGAVIRYSLSLFLNSDQFPWGTLTVNIVGSFIVGVLMNLIMRENTVFSPLWSVSLTVGLCGGLTTFSTFSFDTLELLQKEQWWLAFSNVGLNLFLGILFCALGLLGARYITV